MTRKYLSIAQIVYDSEQSPPFKPEDVQTEHKLKQK